ncbi:LOW QUALITY PROTEIN: baculoviral IAP repeat-containing protein 7 [Trichechus manatus latirostris]|uniref:RING-type E3 ubiquitin transferase n=1 Tax=Trichechus manatus latirostris TaxID=127582 RepID=A0A2Y9RV19_TRIMA|nr:LOW QUALITY PROTEIN: baculoviral IAP repeat-containing protein 7 [Trichechus manatus latirostris]
MFPALCSCRIQRRTPKGLHLALSPEPGGLPAALAYSCALPPALPGNPGTGPRCKHRAVTLAPSKRQQRALAALPVLCVLPYLGPLVVRALVPALLSQLLAAEAGTVPKKGDSAGWESVEWQILGELRTLADEEEEEKEGVEATCRLGPDFSGMDSEELRLVSFHHDWPLSSSVHPAQLTEASFFHMSPQDKVRCFFCCGGLQSWERGDDPWTEHAKWFPRCEFLLQSKGTGFVRSVQDSYSYLLGSWDPLEESGDAVPTAPVHWGPDPPTLRRDSHLEGTEDSGVESIEEQVRRLRCERVCKVCLDRAVDVVCVPCDHPVCAECAPNLSLCPVCLAPVRSCIRTFLS